VAETGHVVTAFDTSRGSIGTRGVVPEPGSIVLVLAGAAGAWFMRRRRRA